MQKIQLYIIFGLSAILSSCGNSNEDYNNISDNILEGTWTSYFEKTDSIILIRVFTPDYYSFFSYADGKQQTEMNKSRYHVDTEHIFLSSYTQTYKLIDDSLWITNSKKDQTTKYIRTRQID